MRVNIKAISAQELKLNDNPSVKRLKLPTQKDSFEQVLAEQIQASVQKKAKPTQGTPQPANTIELQRRSLHLNHSEDGKSINIEIMDDKSEDTLRKISNQSITHLINQGGNHLGGLINTSA